MSVLGVRRGKLVCVHLTDEIEQTVAVYVLRMREVAITLPGDFHRRPGKAHGCRIYFQCIEGDAAQNGHRNDACGSEINRIGGFAGFDVNGVKPLLNPI